MKWLRVRHVKQHNNKTTTMGSQSNVGGNCDNTKQYNNRVKRLNKPTIVCGSVHHEESESTDWVVGEMSG